MRLQAQRLPPPSFSRPQVVVFTDRAPAAAAHVLVIPRAHVDTVACLRGAKDADLGAGLGVLGCVKAAADTCPSHSLSAPASFVPLSLSYAYVGRPPSVSCGN